MHYFLGPVIFVAIWYALTATGVISGAFLPMPSELVRAAWQLAESGELAAHAGATLYRTFVAFAISVVGGLVLGVPLGAWKWLYESVEVVLDFFRSLPSPALIPVAMLVMGIGDAARIAVAAFTCSLINTIHTAYAVRQISERRLAAARLIGLTRRQLIIHVIGPSILPGVVGGWRVTLSLALIIIVVTEMFIGTATGLGMRILDYHQMFRIPEMYALISAVGVIGYLLNKGIEIPEEKLVHWQSQR